MENSAGRKISTRKSLNTVLLLIGLATILFFSLAYVVVTYLIEEINMDREVRSSCEVAVTRLAGTLPLAMWNFDLPNVEASLVAEARSPDIVRILVKDEHDNLAVWVLKTQDGKLSSGTGKFPAMDHTDPEYIHMDADIRIHDKTIGKFHVSASKHTRTQLFLGRMMGSVFTLILNTLVCILVLLVALRLTIIKRIELLSGVVSRFSPARLAIRMEPGRPDEIGQLALSFNSMAQTIADYSQNMEQLVRERTTQLVEAEKLAFLGSLVTGFAHEINTPLGVALTATSFQENLQKQIQARFQDSKLSRKDLEDFFRMLSDSQALVNSGLQRTNNLIQTLKSIGIDQVQGEKRIFGLAQFAEDLLQTLDQRLRSASISYSLDIPRELKLFAPINVFSQILSILALNVITHAYPDGQKGRFDIKVTEYDDQLVMVFQDHGTGISPEYRQRLFTPFFTTRHNEGHVGLGLYIVYTAVKKLDGSISCHAVEGGGLGFTITFPPGLAMKSAR